MNTASSGKQSARRKRLNSGKSNRVQSAKRPTPMLYKLEQERISKENARLLRKFQDVPRSFDILKWRRDEEERQRILKKIARFPE